MARRQAEKQMQGGGLRAAAAPHEGPPGGPQGRASGRSRTLVVLKAASCAESSVTSGPRQCVDLIVGGLRKLEYRGYDSAGVAVVGPAGLAVKRAKGKLQNLVNLLADAPLAGLHRHRPHPLGHPRPAHRRERPPARLRRAWRWSTTASSRTTSSSRAALTGRGHALQRPRPTPRSSPTSSPTRSTAGAATCRPRCAPRSPQVKGTYAHRGGLGEAARTRSSPPRTPRRWSSGSARARTSSPPTCPRSSSTPATWSSSRRASWRCSPPAGIALYGARRRAARRASRRRIEWSAVAAEKDGHKHFMHKEIFEQPRAVADTIRGRASLEQGDVTLDGIELPEDYARSLERIVIVACGTSWHAGLSGRQMIEALARVPVEVELASEFRNRDPLVAERVMCLAISQSGETADTLAAVEGRARRAARRRTPSATWSAPPSRASATAARSSPAPARRSASPPPRPSPPSSPASSCSRSKLGPAARHALRRARRASTSRRSAGCPSWMEQMIRQEAALMPVAKRCASRARRPLPRPRQPVPGRARGRAQAQGDLVHPRRGLRGRRDEARPDRAHRRGPAGGGARHPRAGLREDARQHRGGPRARRPGLRGGLPRATPTRRASPRWRSPCRPAPPLLSPARSSIIPLQFLAYHVADLKGTDVDQPRNLAKSVTVE